jgi:disulfide bond formation protein DsbB
MEEKKEIDKKMLADERKHMEELLCHRFNFFLAIFTIIVGGTFAALLEKNLLISLAILFIGLIILYNIKKTLERCQLKLNIILDELIKEKYPEHPNNKVQEIIDKCKKELEDAENEVKKKKEEIKELKRRCKSKSQKNIIGYGIPKYCLIILWILVIINVVLVILPIYLNEEQTNFFENLIKLFIHEK